MAFLNTMFKKINMYFNLLQTYGFEHMITLHNLEKAGLFKNQTSRTYPTMKKTLKLVIEEVNEQVGKSCLYLLRYERSLSVGTNINGYI